MSGVSAFVMASPSIRRRDGNVKRIGQLFAALVIGPLLCMALCKHSRTDFARRTFARWQPQRYCCEGRASV